ncbi:MAG: hypothetical protein IT249_11840, partial [Chitinophagaceae bacterium]|nr:hypothetical protein [Chitinophagaceae bacterium]
RTTEVGQLTNATTITNAIAKNESNLVSWFNGVIGSRVEITQTIYDIEYGPINGVTLSQKNLRNRVSYTQVLNSATDTYPASATYYTYDVHGNVDTLLQDFGNSSGIANAMNQSGNRFKKMVYNYDLVSGKVNQVAYQPGEADAYYHRYAYDAENRLTDVYSGRDSVMLEIFPEREAHYNYYKHGPLAQTILGQLQVQRQDYAYTLQGWLKAVNPDSTISGMIAKNVYGFVLNYYNNDYSGIGASSPFAGIPSQLGGDNKQLFNGNISSMGVNIPKLGNSILYNFQYDQLNRLMAMDAWNSTNSAWSDLTKVNDYKERLAYDPNGNILGYVRNGTGGSLNLNNYTYSYTAETNRLASITNSVNSSTGTYSYDAIGNVVKDDKQNVSSAEWNVYGKLQSLTKTGGLQINYAYNAGGNRALKVVGDTTEAYVRDASGNIMSVYKKIGSEPLKQSELNMYGSTMIGTVGERTVSVDSVILPGGFRKGVLSIFTRGEKEYLLTDHRGNNMVSITDRRQQNSGAGDTVEYYLADVKTAAYYSAFGAMSNSYNSSLIKYGFNGQRRSTEISSTAQTAEFWEFNGDVGRRLNRDPRSTVDMSVYSVFKNNPILYIDPLGDTTINGQLMEGVNNNSATYLQEILIRATRLSKPPNFEHDFSADITRDLKALEITPKQLRQKVVGKIKEELLPPLPDVIKNPLDRAEQLHKFGNVMFKMYEDGGRSKFPAAYLIGGIIKSMGGSGAWAGKAVDVMMEDMDNIQRQAEEDMFRISHTSGINTLNIKIDSYNQNYQDGFVRLWITKDNLLKIKTDKGVARETLSAITYTSMYNGDANIVYSHMIYFKESQLANPIISIENIGYIPTNEPNSK